MIIDNFIGEYSFLSNDFLHDVVMEGMIYPSTSHAFSAAKTLNQLDRARIRDTKDANKAKQISETLDPRYDWDDLRDTIMFSLLEEKFASTELRKKLMATNNAEIITHDDNNYLGRFLMQLRKEIKGDAIEKFNFASRDFLSACGWQRDYDGDSLYSECWVPPWNINCQYNLLSAIETQKELC